METTQYEIIPHNIEHIARETRQQINDFIYFTLQGNALPYQTGGVPNLLNSFTKNFRVLNC